jgi:hypothetical protein
LSIGKSAIDLPLEPAVGRNHTAMTCNNINERLMHYIIGCGSVAPDIIPTLCLLKTSQQITLIDSETIETTIADPEILAPQGNGLSKAQGLANHFGCRWKADGVKGKSTFQRHD